METAGCTLASSIAAHLARGLQVPQAVKDAAEVKGRKMEKV